MKVVTPRGDVEGTLSFYLRAHSALMLHPTSKHVRSSLDGQLCTVETKVSNAQQEIV